MRANLNNAASHLGPGMVLLVLLPLSANAAESGWLPLRNHNPFLQVYGLPAFQSAEIEPAGESAWRFGLDIANHADAGSLAGEDVVLDGETYILNLSLRRGVTDRLELGIDMPFIGHDGGFLDSPIENWHQLWGLSNTKRGGPQNELRYRYTNAQSTNYEMTAAGWGIGDVRLAAALRLGHSSPAEGRSFALRAGIKLPTGKSARLFGSGGTDYSLGLYATDRRMLSRYKVSLSAVAGVLLPGKGDVLPDIQKDSVGFGGFAAVWQLTGRFGLTTAVYGQTAHYDSELDEIGGHSVQLAVGGSVDFPASQLSLTFALIEDVFDNATTDFALHISVRGSWRNRTSGS